MNYQKGIFLEEVLKYQVTQCFVKTKQFDK